MALPRRTTMEIVVGLGLLPRVPSRFVASLTRKRSLHSRFRVMSSTALTPEAAGRRAQALALQALASSSSSAANPPSTLPTLSMATSLAHAGVSSRDNAPMAPPLHLATTYTRPADGVYSPNDSIYGREDNPTRLLLEHEVAQLECHGRALPKDLVDSPVVCCAFASGMMAVSSLVLTQEAPLHVLLHTDQYMGVATVLVDVFARFHVTTERVDMTDCDAVRTALSALSKDDVRCVLVWMESPSNPQCHVLDIAELCHVVQEHRQQHPNRSVTTVVDSTLAPPPISQPLLLGVDAVMHSATKYLAGHSDATIGVVTVSPWTDQGRILGPRLQKVQTQVGGIASPLDSWLTLRGLRTLALRVTRQSATALRVATFLQMQQPLVTAVHYPGLITHPHHNVAQRQMKGDSVGFGGVLSVELSSAAAAVALAAGLTTLCRATSLGGTETLIEHRASIEPEERRVSPPGLLRLSVGLEDPHDLIADLERALRVVQTVLSEHEATEAFVVTREAS